MNQRTQAIVNHPATAALIAAGAGLSSVLFSTQYSGIYGWNLFVGAPFTVGLLSALCYGWQIRRTFLDSLLVTASSLVILSLLVLLFAVDGAICLVMAMPMGISFALPGTIIGWKLGQRISARQVTTLSGLILCLAPVLVGFEQSLAPQPTLREVRSSVEIHAKIEDVWNQVVSFTEITAEPEWMFRLGIAYPIEARIDGEGVGAVRHCVFSTGAFVEPITVWDKPKHLAFDVSQVPPPMHEISPYRHVEAAHLDGYLVSKRGQFRLTQVGDKVLLEGTTWYTHRIAPEFYWSLLSDAIIRRIHLRVLNHIRQQSEALPR
jgi:hypothetical protein